MHSLSTLALAAGALALPATENQARAAGPSVTIQNGTVVGSSSGGVDSRFEGCLE